jgi:TATA-box binding protein (TBP) (component of TFIID and TFIIIB)
MYTQVSENTFSYLVSLKEIRDEFPESVKNTSYPKLITITMVANIGMDINLDFLRERFNESSLKLTFEGSPVSFIWTVKGTEFYNQVTLSYNDQLSTKSIKIFSNGSIQVAGCTDLFDCQRVIKQICGLLKAVIPTHPDIELEEFRICMINANFQFNREVNLRNCALHLDKQSAMNVTLARDRYAAVKVKFRPADDMKQLTASIFATGKVILSGAETLKEIALGYSHLVQMVSSGVNVLEQATQNIPDEIKFQGYKITEWAEYLAKVRGTLSWKYTYNNRRIIFS